MMWQRQEYPRPQLRRAEWLALNGEWEFDFDDADEGIKRRYDSGKVPLARRINVPFTYQYEASGIGDPTRHERVWYRRTFTPKAGRRALLCFNGADYITDVWVNGKHAVTHTGGYAPFSADITPLLRRGENVLVVRCRDPLDPTLPRGKQSWSGERFGCWYIPNTGLWGSVWLDYFSCDCIEKLYLKPRFDGCLLTGEVTTMYAMADEAELKITLGGRHIKTQRFTLDGRITGFSVKVLEPDFVDAEFAWSPEHPTLFDAEISLFCAGKRIDGAVTRFGFKKLEIVGDTVALNNIPLYQRLILDQGYWPASGITPPSIEAVKEDILLAMRMGFNGARKHQKFEDPYFYYYAEELGFLTWCEMPSAYNFCAEEADRLLREWSDILDAARNFTSIVCYVPLNESWGVRNIASDPVQKDFARAMYYLTKVKDPTRPVSINDGWECLGESDIIGFHDYSYDSARFAEKYNAATYDGVYLTGRKLMGCGEKYRGQPVLLTEFGGIAMRSAVKDGNWGYNDGAADEEEFYRRYGALLDGIYAHGGLKGFCYTQLTDVQQEVNGLLHEDRTPKFDLARICALTKRV